MQGDHHVQPLHSLMQKGSAYSLATREFFRHFHFSLPTPVSCHGMCTDKAVPLPDEDEVIEQKFIFSGNIVFMYFAHVLC